jgi:SSS family solute:Na+ symporter
MENFNLVTFSVLIFLLINLFIGIWAGRGVKTIEDYAIGKKNWSTGALVMTILATEFTGSNLFRGTNGFYKYGISSFAPLIGLIISRLINFFFVSKNIKKFKGLQTMGDVSEKLYGKESKIFTGMISIIYALIVCGMQIEILSLIFKSYLCIDSKLSVILSFTLISIYTCFGGLKSISYTDSFQFIFLVLFLIIFSHILVVKAGGIREILNSLTDKHLTFFSEKNKFSIISAITIQSIFSGQSPAQFQRTLISGTENKFKKVIIISAISWILYGFTRACLGFSLFKLNPSIEGSVILYAFNNYIPIFLKPILILGLFSFIISTADSYLFSSSMILYKDIILPIFNVKNFNLKSFRIITFILSIFSSIFVIYKVSNIRVDYVLSLFSPTVSFPILIGMIGIKFSKKNFWTAVFIGFSTFILAKINLFGNKICDYATFFGLLSNILSSIIMIIYNYINNVKN